MQQESTTIDFYPIIDAIFKEKYFIYDFQIQYS